MQGTALISAISQVLRDLREIVIISVMAWMAALRESTHWRKPVEG